MINDASLKSFLKNKSVVVTGGLGSVGSAIIKAVLAYDVKSIKCLDNRETELFYAQRNNKNSKLSYYFADIRNKDSLNHIMRGVDLVFHAAAMKHVIICEVNPFEAINTNVLGTKNVIESCIENNVGKMILISTDKALNPEGVMGTTKLLAEKMISAMPHMGTEIKTKFGAVRFGNVLYSRGSVLEIWDEQLRRGDKITIVNPEMTRFIMGIPQSVELILSAAYIANNSEIFIMKMPSCSIGTLSEAYLEIKKTPKRHFILTGKTKGDKTHEQLLSPDDADFLLENEKFFLKMPQEVDRIANINMDYYKNLGFKKSVKTNFISSNPENMLNSAEVQEIIKKYIANYDE